MATMKKFNMEAAERAVGKTIKIHGGKIVATVHEAISTIAVIIDYDGYFDPEDKKTRITGRKLITLDELAKPDSISIGQFKHLLSGSYSH